MIFEVFGQGGGLDMEAPMTEVIYGEPRTFDFELNIYTKQAVTPYCNELNYV